MIYPTFIETMLVEQYGVAPLELTKLETFVRRVSEARFNLTAWRGETLWIRGVFDALAMVSVLQGGSRGLDIGSGAGFPGLVLATVMPEMAWVLIDSRRKRVEFLEETCRELDLENVTVVEGRAEEWIRDESGQREAFDVVTARAVGSARVSLELALPFVALGGSAFLPTSQQNGQRIQDETAWAEALGGHFSGQFDGASDGDVVVTIKKDSPTPEHYPRHAKLLGR